MTNNSPGHRLSVVLALASALLVPACDSSARREAEEKALQGVVEFEETTVAFEVGGRVLTLAVREGDHVETGTVVADLDDELLRSSLAARTAEVESARAEVDRVRSGSRREDINAMAARVEAARATEALVEKNLKRERDLFQKSVVAEAAVDELETQLARAKAERESLEQNLLLLKRGAKKEDVELAEARVGAAEAATETDQVKLERHELTAPSNGTVLDTYIEPGEIVAAGTPILSLADTQHPYVDVFVPQAKLEGIGLGSKAQVRVDSLGTTLPGHVEHVARKAEFTPRFLFSERERPNLVIRVRVRVDDPAERLHAGVPAFVTIESKAKPSTGARSASAEKGR
jgi:HlyD family secretion protein